MELVNEGYTNVGQTAKFNANTIKEWRDAGNSDPLKYPNVDWRREVFRPALANTHSISMSGGSEKITFFSSFRYMNNPGVIEKSGIERYDFRTNLDAHPQKWLTLGVNLNGYLQNTGEANDILSEVFTYAQASTPGMVLRAPDGRYGAANNLEDDQQANNVLHRINARTGEEKTLNGFTRFYGALYLLKGLSVNGSFSYAVNSRRQWYKPVFNDRWNFYTNTVTILGTSGPDGRSKINHSSALSQRFFMDVTANYDTQIFRKLSIHAMAGASQEQYIAENISASKLDLIDPSLSVPDAAIGEADLKGGKSVWVMRSYFGRLNLNWDEKYLFEFNLRADGSSRFRPGRRWGYFPSASIGWRLDRESFMSGLTDDWLDALKLRISYGGLGNNSIGNYESQSLYSKANYVFDHTLQLGLAVKALANPMLTWETTMVSNFGLDASIFKNRLTASIDIFGKTTQNILIDLPAPAVHGTSTIPSKTALW